VEELCRRPEDGEDRIALRGGTALGARLRPGGGGGTGRLSAEATYLVTGGLGGLGLLVAERMVARGARTLVLCGRRGASSSSAAAVARLEGAGAKLRVWRADVSDAAEVGGLLARIEAELPPLRGIVHCAGIVDDGILAEQRWQRFARVLAPKVAGTWALQAGVRERPLDFLLLFSSTASVLGAAGQGSYAAANAFLDAAAHELRRHGCRAVAIGWGPWEGIGMAAGDPTLRERSLHRGVRPLDVEEGCGVLERLLNNDGARVVAAAVDWERFARSAGRRRDRGLLAELLAPGLSPDVAPGPPGLRGRIVGAPPEARARILRDGILEGVRKVMGLGPGDGIRADRPLMEQGLDSLMSVELRNLLAAGLGEPLPVGLLFDHPSVDDLCQHLTAQLRTGAAGRQRPDEFAYLDGLAPEELEALVRKDVG
jgi:NAD(P)-dependent dehydrogenase (short-subunit alcohol dehydrogenase family)